VSYTNPTPDEDRAASRPAGAVRRLERARAVQIVAWMGLPQSYLDLGSGTGAMVNMARKMGVDAYGVDLINGPEHWFIAHNLTEPLYTRQSQGARPATRVHMLR
jgi:hypothetical protein